MIRFCYHNISHNIIKKPAFSFKMNTIINEYIDMTNNYYNKALVELRAIFKEEYICFALILAINSAFIIFCAVALFISFAFVSKCFYILWNSLTPGQKLLEFTSIIASLATLTILFRHAWIKGVFPFPLILLILTLSLSNNFKAILFISN